LPASAVTGHSVFLAPLPTDGASADELAN